MIGWEIKMMSRPVDDMNGSLIAGVRVVSSACPQSVLTLVPATRKVVGETATSVPSRRTMATEFRLRVCRRRRSASSARRAGTSMFEASTLALYASCCMVLSRWVSVDSASLAA